MRYGWNLMLITAGICTYCPDAMYILCEAMMPCPVGKVVAACNKMYGLQVAPIELIMRWEGCCVDRSGRQFKVVG